MNVQEIGSFFSPQYGGAPWSWAKFVDLVKHVWPVVAIATFGGLAYNMRVMRANLLDTLNAQYVETARAKGLSEGAVIMRHAVPNALHPLIMYQGVVLPYMLTGEIEVAIVFSLATVGPAIVSSMAVGDVYVTRHLHDGAGRDADRRQHHRRHAARPARSARPARWRQRMTDTRLPGDLAAPVAPSAPDPQPEAMANPQAGRFAHGNETYLALVWRRFRRSVIGMIGLVLVLGLLLMAVFADFFAPVNPKDNGMGFAPPETTLLVPHNGRQPSRRSTAHLSVRRDRRARPGYLPAGDRPRLRQPAPARLLRAAAMTTSSSGLIPAQHAFLRRAPTASRSTCSAPTSSAATSSRAPSSARASRSPSRSIVVLHHDDRSAPASASPRAISVARFDAWVQRFVDFVLAFPQLPLYLALTSLIPVTAPSNVFIAFVIGRDWRRSAGRSCPARCAARRWRWRASSMCGPPSPSAPATGASFSATSCPTC